MRSWYVVRRAGLIAEAEGWGLPEKIEVPDVDKDGKDARKEDGEV